MSDLALRAPETLLMAEIMAVGVELSLKGAAQVFCRYSGHVNVFYCDVYPMGTDYQNVRNKTGIYEKIVEFDSADPIGALSEILAYLHNVEV